MILLRKLLQRPDPMELEGFFSFSFLPFFNSMFRLDLICNWKTLKSPRLTLFSSHAEYDSTRSIWITLTLIYLIWLSVCRPSNLISLSQLLKKKGKKSVKHNSIMSLVTLILSAKQSLHFLINSTAATPHGCWVTSSQCRLTVPQTLKSLLPKARKLQNFFTSSLLRLFC